MNLTIPSTTLALSGAPYSGKTESVAALSAFFERKGIKYKIFPEIARQLINEGLSYKDGVYAFQSELIRRSIVRLTELSQTADPHTVYVFDRGMPDCFAYLTAEEGERLLAEHGLSRADLYSPYSLCLFLRPSMDAVNKLMSVSTDDTSDAQYRLEGSPEEIERLDKITYAQWSHFHNLRVIEAADTLDAKIAAVLAEAERCIAHNSSQKNR